MSIIAITDNFDCPGEQETAVLGDLVGMELGADTEVILVWHTTVDAALVDRLPRLRGVQRYGVGFDNLDLDVLNSRGIIGCNNPDYGVDEVSDTAIGMLLTMTRCLARYNALARGLTDTWQENIVPTIRRSSETTLGVVGAGRIGGSVLLKARALGFRTFLFDPYQPRGIEKTFGAARVDRLDHLLERADVVSLHCPLNHETHGLVDERFLLAMKPGACLINTARGGLVASLDQIHNALSSGHLDQIAFDVLPEEPAGQGPLLDAWRDPSHPLADRILINPHVAYYSQEAADEMRRKAAENALRLYRGETPANRVV